jgi:hydrophobic/amphiphilic exporter-1 (mainly G- bacteria), HAE1 family
MWLTKFAIARRVTILMFIMGLVVLGLVGLSRMPWDLNPKVDFPIVTVIVPYPGASPDEIEQRVVKPLEDQVSVINGVDRVVSQAQENVGTVTVRFQYGVSTDVGAADVRDALDRARALFPDGVKSPSIYKLDIGAQPVITLGITGSRPPRDLRKLVDDEIKAVLGQVPGVAAVSVEGGELREIQVLADRERLDAAGLSIAQLSRQLTAENLDLPAGSIKEGMRDYAVRARGQFTSTQEIRDLRISTPRGSVPLSALAEVRDTVAEPSEYARTNGQPTVNVSVLKQSDANTVKVVEGVRDKLRMLVGDGQKPGLMPADIKATVSEDESSRVKEAIFDVRDALIYGALLAALVVFLFLHNFRATIIVALAIPTCVLATFLPIGMGLHFTLNTMVMLGLALSVGILVDDSIVVIENIDRHLKMGEMPEVAAYNGRTEIGAAAVALTAVDVVVYIPVAMMGGIVGRFFYSFGITVFICTIFSLLVAFTLTPMLASWWYERVDKAKAGRAAAGVGARLGGFFDRAYRGLERRYVSVLRPAIRHPYLTLLAGYGVLVATVVLLGPKLGVEFFPRSDAGRESISVEMAVGTRLEETDRVVRRLERELLDKQKYPEITDISTVVGRGAQSFIGGGSSGPRYARVGVTMKRRRARLDSGERSDLALAADLRKAFADVPSAVIKVNPGQAMGGGGADIEYNILSDDREALDRAAAQLMRALKQLPGFYYVDLSSKPGRPEVHARIDRLRAADYGMSAAEIATTVRTAFAGSTDTKYRESGDEYDLRVQFREFDRSQVADVGNLFLGMAHGAPVRLRDVAEIEMSSGPSQVERYNRQRNVTVSASLVPGLSAGVAQKMVQDAAAKIAIPGVTFGWTGTVQMMGESFGYMGQAVLLSIILIYLVTAALYNSVLEPLNVMLTLPMAMAGAIFGLWVTHNNISMVALIGFIMLMGIVGKNAILVVDYTNTLRGRGMARREALETAGPHRMQPVLMTTVATIMGMMPTALALNEGSEWRSPMAIAVIFGLAFSTLLSLVVVPATYCIWDDLGIVFAKLFARIFPRFGDKAEKF